MGPGDCSLIRRLLSFSLAVWICFCLLIATERQAWGYVDPGSGLLALQSIASVLAAAGFFLRRNLRNLFSRGADKKVAMSVPAKEGTPANLA